MKYRVSLITAVILLSQFALFCSVARAGNFGFGVHNGYGIIKFSEKENFLGENFESDSRHPAVLVGGSGEYSLSRPQNFYVGITTDWAFGLKDTETWTQDSQQFQTNDIKIFGQFYDLRFGYKNILDNLSYRFYVSGGWDGLRFQRDNFLVQGSPSGEGSREKMSLWRTGIGSGFGYSLSAWAVDARGAVSYYPAGRTRDSSLSGVTFDTHGTCLDFGLGVARAVKKNMHVYLGASYTLQKLDGDEEYLTSQQTVSWESKLVILVGVVNLTYAF
jgi:hypothetical protein